MAVRFRKSKKVAPGTKINLGTKSAGVSFGGRGGGVSFNSKTGARVRASIPGTGLYFSRKLGGRKRRKSKKRVAVGGASYIVAALVAILICWIFPIAIPLFILGAVVVFVLAIVAAKRGENAGASDDVPDDLDVPAVSDRSVSVICPGCSGHFTIQYKVAAYPDGVLKYTCPKCKTESVVNIPT